MKKFCRTAVLASASLLIKAAPADTRILDSFDTPVGPQTFREGCCSSCLGSGTYSWTFPSLSGPGIMGVRTTFALVDSMYGHPGQVTVSSPVPGGTSRVLVDQGCYGTGYWAQTKAQFAYEGFAAFTLASDAELVLDCSGIRSWDGCGYAASARLTWIVGSTGGGESSASVELPVGVLGPLRISAGLLAGNADLSRVERVTIRLGLYGGAWSTQGAIDLLISGITIEDPDRCSDADLFRDSIVNGADLGILLSQWGPNPSPTVSDLNRDGAVDGMDLGLPLSFWGPCP